MDASKQPATEAPATPADTEPNSMAPTRPSRESAEAYATRLERHIKSLEPEVADLESRLKEALYDDQVSLDAFSELAHALIAKQLLLKSFLTKLIKLRPHQ